MGIPLNLKCNNYTKNIITNGFITAILFSSFIYFEYFEISNKAINTITVLISYYLFIKLDKNSMFYTGFFIGILWFYWVSYSFIYYDMVYLIPFVIFAIAMVYGIVFYIVAYFKNIFVRIVLLYSLTFFTPFGFNWFKIDLPLINTYFNTYNSDIKQNRLNIYMPQYNLNQDDKWKQNNINQIVNTNFKNIEDGITKKYDIVILPETVFPFDITKYPIIQKRLLELSKQITIITGALYSKNGLYYNSTYMFQNNQINIANKVVLVPFGESVPTFKFIRDIINDIFFDGAKDYEVALEATTFEIKNQKFRNAICYEATTDEIYKNLDTPYIIVTSNNAWFTPSIEPILQKLLLKYYAKKYHLFIYHSTNKSSNMMIR
jgi:apolipoprotein N-acyltransferase